MLPLFNLKARKINLYLEDLLAFLQEFQCFKFFTKIIIKSLIFF